MTALSPISNIYKMVVNARNALYDREVLKSFSLGAKTISIGNITAGGTGKTPLVALVAEILAEKGDKVCILTRGYGRKNAGERVLVSDGENVLVDAVTGGDEPVELARKLLGKAIVVADSNRVAASKWALEKFGITAFVLDDGFQHRRAKRDLDIVCIDATNPFGDGLLLPAGILREPIRNLDRADEIVITRANLAGNIENLKSQISNLNRTAVTMMSENKTSALTELQQFHAIRQSSQKLTAGFLWRRLAENFDGARLIAFCGLGNPENFFSLLSAEIEQYEFETLDLFDTHVFRDHHYYSQADIEMLEMSAREGAVDAFLTTAKDAVKLKYLNFTIPCFVVEIDSVINDLDRFRNLL